MSSGNGQGSRKGRRLVIALLAALAVAMMLVSTAAGLWFRWVKKPTLHKPEPSLPPVAVSQAPAESEPPEEDCGLQPKVAGERRSEDIYTILVFGADETSGLNDSIMVATYDVTNRRATVMSIPRDTLINSGARGSLSAKKINAVNKVYGGGERGLEALKAEVSELVGFVPDFYIQIDWQLVGDVVDAIGGVWFDIPYHMDYDDVWQDLHIHYDTGRQFLTGADAMNVVRWRKNNWNSAYYGEGGGSDTTRLKVQHSFLAVVLDQVLQFRNITKIGQLADLLSSRVESDLTVENMLWFGSQAVFSGLRAEDVEFCTMPVMGGTYGRDSFVYPVQSQLLTLINESLNPYVEEVTVRQLDLMGVNADGSLRSSTGRLADPALGVPPVVETEAPAAESEEPEEEATFDWGHTLD